MILPPGINLLNYGWKEMPGVIIFHLLPYVLNFHYHPQQPKEGEKEKKKGKGNAF